ncbi:hypothetical protein Aperf_G00000098383 [Anoplocephala perfoliata]
MKSNEIVGRLSFREGAITMINPLSFCIICVIYVLCAILIQLRVYSFIKALSVTDLWFLRISTITISYALIYLPITILKKIAPFLLQQWESETNPLSSTCRLYLTACFLNHLPYNRPLLDPPSPSTRSSLARASDRLSKFAKQHRWMTLVSCTLGLNFVYIFWGVLQEKIMTRSYNGEHFREPQFLVFCNRVGALITALVCLSFIGSRGEDSTSETKPPLSSYAHPALSNIISSWCQYEALLFITFPVQVISKSFKAIPVMLMGRLLYGRPYKAYEYITTALIGAGVCIFILSSPTEHKNKVAENSISGLILICCYIVFDSYTSNSQDNLFRTYKMSPLQMMRGVSSWAVLFTITPPLADGTLAWSLRFAWNQPQFAFDAAASAVCSGFGQVLIFATIAEFGAVTFSLIVTVRQCLSILISCLLFAHPLNAPSIGGLLITFGAIFARIMYKRIFAAFSSSPKG